MTPTHTKRHAPICTFFIKSGFAFALWEWDCSNQLALALSGAIYTLNPEQEALHPET